MLMELQKELNLCLESEAQLEAAWRRALQKKDEEESQRTALSYLRAVQKRQDAFSLLSLTITRRRVAEAMESSGFSLGDLLSPEPPPTGEGEEVWPKVIEWLPSLVDDPELRALLSADMKERDRQGRERYDTPLRTHNGRDALKDAYQEILDAVVYQAQASLEQEEAGLEDLDSAFLFGQTVGLLAALRRLLQVREKV